MAEPVRIPGPAVTRQVVVVTDRRMPLRVRARLTVVVAVVGAPIQQLVVPRVGQAAEAREANRIQRQVLQALQVLAVVAVVAVVTIAIRIVHRAVRVVVVSSSSSFLLT